MKNLAAPQPRSWEAGCESWPYYMLLMGGRAQTRFIELGDNDVLIHGWIEGYSEETANLPFFFEIFYFFLKNLSKIK